MFGRKIDPNERRKVLELLSRWSHAIARIDRATDAMRLTVAEQPLGMQSEEFEKARLAALAVVAGSGRDYKSSILARLGGQQRRQDHVGFTDETR